MYDVEQAAQVLSSLAINSPKIEALVETMYLAASADGDFAPEEMAQFVGTFQTLTNKRHSSEETEGLVSALAARVKEEGRDARLASLRTRLTGEKERETALILAASIVVSDGVFESDENDLLADLAEALEIETGRAVDLVQKVQRRAR